jgi:16S rRNA (adenine1518-N6/adenine1519-N6)-dimethyltransferase
MPLQKQPGKRQSRYAVYVQKKTQEDSGAEHRASAKHAAKKSLGQHFLTSQKALNTMVRASGITHDDIVLEVGPGKGILTRKLLDAGAIVIAVEMDAELLPLLETTFAPQIAAGKLRLIHSDILKFDVRKIDDEIGRENFDAVRESREKNSEAYRVYGDEVFSMADNAVRKILTSYKVVANIPYYITGEIIRMFLSGETQPSSMTLLVQKEVAERIVKSKKESILSLSVKVYGTPTYVETVPRGAFSPAPTVDSAVLHIADISRTRLGTLSDDNFFTVVKTGFASKRKQLGNTLRSLFGENTSAILLSVGITENARAEDVPLEKWIELAEKYTKR